MKVNKKILKYLPFILIFIFGLLIRIVSIYPSNTIVGFDQARDFFDTKKIMAGDLRIVGPTAGNNADLHHGVAFLYYIILPIMAGGSNPLWIAIWNSLFNSTIGIVLGILSFLIFKNKKASLVTAFLASISFYLIQYSGWLSNPTVTLLTVPLIFLGLFLYKNKKDFGLPLALFFLGATIQFEIFFLYLIPVIFLIWLILKFKFPNFKTLIISFFSFCLATSTMIATEIKFGFSGIISLFFSSGNQQNIRNQYFKEFIQRYFKTFSETIYPNSLDFGIIVALLLIGFLIFEFVKNRKNREYKNSLLFLGVYILSPFVLFSLGYHKAPWFLIGLPPAILLGIGLMLSKVKNVILIPIILLLTFTNLSFVKKSLNKGQILLEPDSSALLSKQLEVINYTYEKSQNNPFSINTVTNPLYINAIWAYNYSFMSDKYGYKPTWIGGDQEYPYNTLEKPKGSEIMFFLIVDNSGRIPQVHIYEAEKWANSIGKLIEKRDFEGIYVNTYTY